MPQQTLIFLGPQGSGKGTQLQLFKDYLQSADQGRRVVHYDSGAALRAFKDTEGYTQGMVRESLAKGEIQPDFLAVTLFGNAFVRDMTGNEHVLLDGFPRTISQAHIFETAMRFYKRDKVMVINLDLSEPVVTQRMLKRGRQDDTEVGIRTRLAWYRAHVVPMLEYCKSNPLYDVLDINGDQAIERVHEDIVKIAV
jgi:adenylate kinase